MIPTPTIVPAAVVAAVATAQAQAADPIHAVLHANMANSVTGVYGLSGSGKSSLADTAAEYAYRIFGKITLAYTADLGGYGTKRLALIRRGIVIGYDPRNHVNPFETMELITQGAFPSYLLPGGPATQDERDRGWAPPDAELILPTRKRWQMVCPNGHRNGKFYAAADIVKAGVVTCACGHPCSASDPRTTIEEQLVQSAGFARVGHRIYDSMTAMNEWGLSDLQKQSALGLLPAGAKGGSLLGGADALVSGTVKYGSSSQGQYGFLQTRSHDWIANTKMIAGSVIPPTMTFGVEMSKGDDESGGQPVFGPKIAGNARTSHVPGWLGNCVHAVREPIALDQPNTMVHRLWLKNHVDQLDPRRVPYLAKTRAVPGLPDYLEDAPGTTPWSACSLDVLYTKLAAQVAEEEARLAALYPEVAAEADEEEAVIKTGAAAVLPSLAGPGPRPTGVVAQAATSGVGGAAAVVPAAQPGRPRVSVAPSIAVAPVAAVAGTVPPSVAGTVAAPVTPPVTGAAAPAAPVAAPSAPVAPAAPVTRPAVTAAAPVVAAAPAPAPPPPPAAPAATTAGVPAPPGRRVPRPPV